MKKKSTISILLLTMLAMITATAYASSCSTDEECAGTEYCAKTQGSCDGEGQCTTRPSACQPYWQPVCGCDDALYYNPCEAAYFGESVLSEGACAPDATDPEEIQICDYVLTNFRVDAGNKIGSTFTYSDETFNAYTADGRPIGHLVLREKEVTSVGCGVLQTPTYNVYVKDLATIEEIFNAKNRLDIFEEKLSDDSIRLEGVRFTKKIKGSMTKAVIKVWSWFR